jgi:hypothetical protein
LKAAPPGWKTTRELLRLRYSRNHFGAEINFYESFFLNFPGHPCSAAWNYPSVGAVKLNADGF